MTYNYQNQNEHQNEPEPEPNMEDYIRQMRIAGEKAVNQPIYDIIQQINLDRQNSLVALWNGSGTNSNSTRKPSAETCEKIRQSLECYKYIDEIDEFIPGSYIRWISEIKPFALHHGGHLISVNLIKGNLTCLFRIGGRIYRYGLAGRLYYRRENELLKIINNIL
jgi:hypothetical protein